MNDAIVRQLEQYINSNNTLQDLKRILSISGDDEEFLQELKKKNTELKR